MNFTQKDLSIIPYTSMTVSLVGLLELEVKDFFLFPVSLLDIQSAFFRELELLFNYSKWRVPKTNYNKFYMRF